MKQFFSFLTVVAFSFALISCGGDDNTPSIPEGTPESVTDSKSISFEVLASKGSGFDIPQTLKLEDFAKLKDFAKYVTEAKMDPKKSFIKISGIKEEAPAVKTLMLSVEGTDIRRTFENVKNGTFDEYDTDLEFLNQVIKRLGEQKSIVLKLQGQAEEEINKELKVEIILTADFIR